MIHFYELTTMSASQRLRLLRRAELQIDELTERVRPIIQAVRERGDEALIEFTARFDHVQLSPGRLRVEQDEIDMAHQFNLIHRCVKPLNTLFEMFADSMKDNCPMINGLQKSNQAL